MKVVLEVVLEAQKQILQELGMFFEIVEEDKEKKLVFIATALFLHLYRFFTVFTTFSFSWYSISLLASCLVAVYNQFDALAGLITC